MHGEEALNLSVEIGWEDGYCSSGVVQKLNPMLRRRFESRLREKSDQNMSLRKELEDQALALGADLFGVAKAEAFSMAPSGHRPTDIVPEARSVIVLGMKYLDMMVDLLPTGREEDALATSREKMFAGHNDFLSAQLDRIGFALAKTLEKKGFKAYHQLSSQGGTDDRYLVGMVSLKHLAVEAGLGSLGCHSLLITPQYGPRVRLTAIITDAEIRPTDNPIGINFCEMCVEKPCISLCPVGALKQPEKTQSYNMDRFLCAQYRRTRPTCSTCLKVCVGGRKRPQGEAEIESRKTRKTAK